MTLSPEIDAKLIEQADQAWHTWFLASEQGHYEFQKWFLGQLRAAATVAVEGMEAEFGQREQEMSAQIADLRLNYAKHAGRLQAELAELLEQLTTLRELHCNQAATITRLHAELCKPTVYEKTTPEEAKAVHKAWMNSDGYAGYVAFAAEIDKLIEKRLPQGPSKGVDVTDNCAEIARQLNLAGGGMTIDIEQEAWNITPKPRRAVAEAVAAERADHENSWVKKSVLEAANRHHATDAAKLTEANQGLLQELALLKERHAQELQEALAAERDRFNKSWDVRTGRNQEAFKEQEERHAAELAQVKAELAQQYQEQSDNDQRWQSRLAQERANWQARLERERVSMAEEALCQECFEKIKTAGWKIIRDLRSKPQEEGSAIALPPGFLSLTVGLHSCAATSD